MLKQRWQFNLCSTAPPIGVIHSVSLLSRKFDRCALSGIVPSKWSIFFEERLLVGVLGHHCLLITSGGYISFGAFRKECSHQLKVVLMPLKRGMWVELDANGAFMWPYLTALGKSFYCSSMGKTCTHIHTFRSHTKLLPNASSLCLSLHCIHYICFFYTSFLSIPPFLA